MAPNLHVQRSIPGQKIQNSESIPGKPKDGESMVSKTPEMSATSNHPTLHPKPKPQSESEIAKNAVA